MGIPDTCPATTQALRTEKCETHLDRFLPDPLVALAFALADLPAAAGFFPGFFLKPESLAVSSSDLAPGPSDDGGLRSTVLGRVGLIR